ncbi:MAG: PIN domain-containing protein [Acidimicrobiia bacterium]|nr:PIN domain-containing protein [Acidimicrobiia bacterium]
MLVDANLLLYAADETSERHAAAAEWLEAALTGDRRVGIPWQSIGAFLRISTHPRVATRPLTGGEAWDFVDDLMHAEPVWIPPATERTASVLAGLMRSVPVTGNLVTDAQLAALALEHGLAVYSADSDFARFPGLTWVNPLQP